MYVFFFFFFFQAEDGIRDHCVTGVQTCALPISSGAIAESRGGAGEVGRRRRDGRRSAFAASPPGPTRSPSKARSEERRVGKECRSRWSTDHEKKKKIEHKNDRVYNEIKRCETRQ